MQSIFFGPVSLFSFNPRCGCAARNPRCDRRCLVVARSSGRKPNPRLPDSGYFAEADPKAEVYSPFGGVSSTGDYTKRGGRYAQEFIWNTNWQKQMEYEESIKKAREQKKKDDQNPQKPGVVSFNRRSFLDSMDVDLSEQLRPRKKTTSSSPSKPSNSRGKQDIPTQGERRQWSRSGRYATRAVALDPNNPTEAELLAERVEEERARFKELKQELQLWTVGSAAAIFCLTAAFYPQDVVVSYAVGAVAGLMYLRLLNRTVDAYGGFTLDFGGALGQQRLLIPFILALGYNRWNALASDQTGIELLLLPMLLGFFTYKGAVVARQSISLFNEMMDSMKAEMPATSSAVDGTSQEATTQEVQGAAEAEATKEAMKRLEKEFRDKMLMQ